VACALLLGVWLASGFYGVAWVGSPRFVAFVDGGLFGVYWRETPTPGRLIMDYLVYMDWPRAGRHPKMRCDLAEACHRAIAGKGVVCARCPWIDFGVGERCQLVNPRNSPARMWALLIPIWLPFILLAAPLAFLWLSRPRTPPGHCRKCGYDLTGNVSGRCPECGTPVQRDGETA